MVSTSESQAQDHAFDSHVNHLAHQNRRKWAMGDNNCVLVHSAVNEYLKIDRYGNYTWNSRGALKRVSGCISFREMRR